MQEISKKAKKSFTGHGLNNPDIKIIVIYYIFYNKLI